MGEIMERPSGTIVKVGFAATSSLDRMEAIADHGTHQGYLDGCHGSHCPGREQVGMTCAEANTRFAGDASYRRRVQAGMSAAAIWAEDQLDAENEAEARRQLRRKPSPMRTEASVSFEDSVEPLDAVAPEALPEPVEAPRPARWAVRRVWVAVAPDGKLNGPHESQEAAMAFLAKKLAPKKPPAPKRPRGRVWTEEQDALIRQRHGEGISDKKIAGELGVPQGQLSLRRNALGLPALFRSPNVRGSRAPLNTGA